MPANRPRRKPRTQPDGTKPKPEPPMRQCMICGRIARDVTARGGRKERAICEARMPPLFPRP